MGLRLEQLQDDQKGCPARPQRSEEARRTLRYVELLSDATCLREALRRRQGTPLADFFSILLVAGVWRRCP
ncbi:MAG: hypothetical protein AABY94_04480, partial [Nitrospirota bacterium]